MWCSIVVQNRNREMEKRKRLFVVFSSGLSSENNLSTTTGETNEIFFFLFVFLLFESVERRKKPSTLTIDQNFFEFSLRGRVEQETLRREFFSFFFLRIFSCWNSPTVFSSFELERRKENRFLVVMTNRKRKQFERFVRSIKITVASGANAFVSICHDQKFFFRFIDNDSQENVNILRFRVGRFVVKKRLSCRDWDNRYSLKNRYLIEKLTMTMSRAVNIEQFFFRSCSSWAFS